MAEQVSVELTSWNKLPTPNLAVAPELLGESHVFTFEGHDVTISLPTVESLPDYDTPGGFVMGKRLSISTWQPAEDRQLQPTYVNLHDVDVVVSIPGRTSIPEAARTKPITHEFFSEEQEKYLDKLASDYGELAFRVYDLWLRTLRWKSDDYRVGTPELSGVETAGWRTEVREKDSTNRFWASGHSIILYVEKPVTAEVWIKISATLGAGETPPIYYDLLYAAMAHLERGDLKLTIVDAAVAAETYMRIVVEAGLPDGLDNKLKKYIRVAPASRVRDEFFPERLNKEQKTAYGGIKPDLKTLFEDRNTIMHSGKVSGLTAEHCKKLINSVRDLLSL